jgi:hypothetical protein
MGRLNNLSPIYKDADLILLPVIEGTGLPIKTIDAIVAEKPFVATSGAIKGIGGIGEYVSTFDTPEAFAAEAIRLLSDREYRNAFIDRIRTFRRRYFRVSNYYRAVDGLLRSAGIQVPLITDETANDELSWLKPESPNLEPSQAWEAGPFSLGANVDRVFESRSRDGVIIGNHVLDRNYLWIEICGDANSERVARLTVDSLRRLKLAASINGSPPKYFETDALTGALLIPLDKEGRGNVELYVADDLDFLTRSAIRLGLEQL